VVGAIERRFLSPEVSYPAGLSLLLHGLLALAVVYAPQWLRSKPFRVPVSYEVTLVAPFGAGGQAKASLSHPPGPKVATAPAKAAASSRQAAQPKDLLSLPSIPRPVVPKALAVPQTPVAPQSVVRPLPASTRADELTLPAKRSLPDRRAPAPLVPPPAPPIVAPAKPAPSVVPIVPPAVTPPPPLLVVKPAPVRFAPVAPPAPLATTPTVVAPQVAPPPAISEPVIKAPVVTVPKLNLETHRLARLEAKTVKPAVVAPQAVTPPASEGQGQSGAGQGIGVGADTGVTVGNTDPALAYYIVLVQEKIDSNWVPPKRASGTVDTAVLSVRVLRSGQTRDLVINSSSGDRAFDDSALRAVRLSSPLPPLPPLYKTETVILELRFNFEGVRS